MISRKLLVLCIMFMSILFATNVYAKRKDNNAPAFFFLKGMNIDLPQLIQGVEKSENGKVVSFEIESERHNPFQLEMKMVKDGKTLEVTVAPKSGKILDTESQGFFSRLWDDDDIQALPETKFSLEDAITLVEKRYGGEVLRGAFQKKSGLDMFRMMVANNDGAFTVMVDANNGELFRVSERADRDHHGEHDE